MTSVKSASKYTLAARLPFWDLTRWTSHGFTETAFETGMGGNK
jgi:hypothetical protein